MCYLDLESYGAGRSEVPRIVPGEAAVCWGSVYRFQGRKAEAVSHYDKYLARHPDGEEPEVARNALAELR